MIPIRSWLVSAVVLQDGRRQPRTLLLQRAKAAMYGEWSYVAGSVETGETAPQAIRRELIEETGLVPRRLYSADFCEQFYEAQRASICIVPAFVAFVDPQAAITLNTEHDDWRWVSLSQAIDLVPFGGQRRLFEHVRENFIRRPPACWLEV
ncbi:MAG: NUDIX domain-containing protein [Gammaproteobacteria bacterium]|nr:NUDIX domain-containing protein [Gammaproteobacteria bacterium]